MTPEHWKPVLGFEGRYEISDHGNIRSICKHFLSSRILHPGTGTHGYLYVLLYPGDGTRVVRLVHRLVIEAFSGHPIPPKMDVNHKDGNKKANHLENLELMSRSQNQLHAFRVLHRLIKPPRGEESGHAILTEKKVFEIRALYAAGASYLELARKFKMSRSAICHVVKRRSWKHVNI